MPAETYPELELSASHLPRYKKYVYPVRNLYRKWALLEPLPPFFACFDLYVMLAEGKGYRFRDEPPASLSSEEKKYWNAYERYLRKLIFEPAFAEMCRIVRRDAGRKEARIALALRLLLYRLSPYISQNSLPLPMVTTSLLKILETTPYTPLNFKMVQNEEWFSSRDAVEALYNIQWVFQSLTPWEKPFIVPTPEAEEMVLEKKASRLPLGGYSELTNAGSFESIVPTEMAYLSLAEDYFTYKFANSQLLYYARDTESEIRVLKKTLVLGAWLNADWASLPYLIGKKGILGRRVAAGVLLRASEDALKNSRGKLHTRIYFLGTDSTYDARFLSFLSSPSSPQSALPFPPPPSPYTPILSLESPLSTCPMENKFTRGHYFSACLLASEADLENATEYCQQYYDRYALVTLTDEKLQSPNLLHEEVMKTLISLTA